MGEFQYKAGVNNVGSYQVSGIPFVVRVQAPVSTNTPIKIDFPSLTKYLIIKNYTISENIEEDRYKLVRFIKTFEKLRDNKITDYAPRYTKFLTNYGY